MALAAPVVHVAPTGNDAWSGSLAEANALATDGPVRSLERARDVARELRRAQPALAEPLVVELAGGVYRLGRTLVLGAEDGGTPASPTIWRAREGESAILSGGRQLTGWAVGADGRWRLTLPADPSGEWAFQQLFVDGARRNRARLPKRGFFTVDQEATPTAAAQAKGGADRFRYAPGDLDASWRDLGDVEILSFQQWSMARNRIASIDPDRRLVSFTGATWNPGWMGGPIQGARYLVENVAEALTEPGEWRLDRASREVTYIPMPGETPDGAVVVAPRLTTLLELRGEERLGLGVSHLSFEGLTFEHTNWVTPADGWNFPQAEATMPAAVYCVEASDCSWVGCEFRQVAGYALEWSRGCKRNRVDSSVLHDLGAGGVRIGELFVREDEALCASDNVVENCVIRSGGRTHPAGMGVVIGHSPRNHILRNEIADFYNTGVSIGWSWGYGPSNAHDNEVGWNRIHQLGQGVTSDMGGIYTLGLMDGTILHDNAIWDIHCYPPGYGGWGIYFDEGTTHIVAERNLVHDTSSGSLHQNYGKENVVRNNILAFAETGQLQRSRTHDHLAFTVERNVIYWDRGTPLGAHWPEPHFAFDHNLYWDARGQEVRFGDGNWAEWQARGLDAHSLIADPLFRDAAERDFTLQPDSPALAMGFEPLRPEQAGCRLTEAQLASAGELPRAWPEPGPLVPFRLDQDFEACEPGDRCPGTMTMHDPRFPEADILATDALSASGRMSLRFLDRAGLEHPWDPHLYFTPGLKQGVVVESFDLRVETGNGFYHEWRTNGSPYVVGPGLYMADGWLLAGRERVVELPRGEWVHIEAACGVGDSADGSWSVTVSLPGREPIRLEGLTCPADFRDLWWWGFSSNEDAEGEYLLDNLGLQVRE